MKNEFDIKTFIDLVKDMRRLQKQHTLQKM